MKNSRRVSRRRGSLTFNCGFWKILYMSESVYDGRGRRRIMGRRYLGCVRKRARARKRKRKKKKKETRSTRDRCPPGLTSGESVND